MPDPVLYWKAMLAAAGVSACVVLTSGRLRQPAGRTRLIAAGVVGIGLGLLCGYWMLQIRPAWPPTNALGRLLAIVVPLVLGIELLAASERVPAWLGWLMRIGLAAVAARILLHDSVHLDGNRSEWSEWQVVVVQAICGVLLITEWSALDWLSTRPAAYSIPLAMAEATWCAGIAIMLAGYLRGGEAAFPLVAALVGVTGAMRIVTTSPVFHGAIGVGVVGLFGLLFIGRFFGGLSTPTALILFISPLLCCATELPLLRFRNPWIVGVLRMALVTIPLVVVLAGAKRDFDRDMAPLLGVEAGQR